jgi:hypothetical protein
MLDSVQQAPKRRGLRRPIVILYGLAKVILDEFELLVI